MSESENEILAVEPLPGYAPKIGRWLWALEDARRRTKATLLGIEQAALDYQASPEDNTVGTLLYHIAAIEMDWLHTDVLEQDFPPEVAHLLPYDVRDEGGKLIPVQGLSPEEHLARLDATRAITLMAFREMTPKEFRRKRRIVGYDVTPEWVLHHLMQHEAEHRGQIGELRATAEEELAG